MTTDQGQRVPQLAAWLDATDIALLELQGPGIALRLLRDPASGRVKETIGYSVAGVSAEATRPVGDTAAGSVDVIACARSVGILRRSHPQTGQALAPVGTTVRAGQPLALIQVGTLLLPVLAEQDGTVVGLQGSDGTTVGYGDVVSQLRTGD